MRLDKLCADMAILSKQRILHLVNSGELKFEPPISVHEASERIDGVGMHLPISNVVLIPKTHKGLVRRKVFLGDRPDYAQYYRKLELKPNEGFVLKPGQTVLLFTHHRIQLPPYLAANLSTRTNAARFFFSSHSTAPLLHPHTPGDIKSIVLEAKNSGDHDLVIKGGDELVQLSFNGVSNASPTLGRHRSSEFPDSAPKNVPALQRWLMRQTGRITTRKPPKVK
jgi:deoxycytidine triphosphate deaminase